MINGYKKIAEETKSLSVEFAKTNDMLLDKWKTKSSDICASRLNKIFISLDEISEELRRLPEDDAV